MSTTFTHVVKSDRGDIIFVGTEEECDEWAALTGAEWQTDLGVEPYREEARS